MFDEIDLMVCVDCALYLSNGELDTAADPAAVLVGESRLLGEAQGAQLGAGDPELTEDFGAEPCDCCGSPLAGERKHVVLLIPETRPGAARD